MGNNIPPLHGRFFIPAKIEASKANNPPLQGGTGLLALENDVPEHTQDMLTKSN
jgi:hypothetical protein